MARPTTITDEQILVAAREVFLKQGISASTADIACKANISEGSLFNRFPTKDALFVAAMKTPPVPACLLQLEEQVGKGDLRQNVTQVALEFIAFLNQVVPLMMVAWNRKPPTEEDQECCTEHAPARDRRLLTHYLQQEQERGRLCSCNTDTLARMLIGTLVSYVMDNLALKLSPSEAETHAFVESMMETVWKGIAPSDTCAASLHTHPTSTEGRQV